ncbi:hypothetical protein [Romboutsia sp.]|uniref:hypothetical protein n=1 Tax=Romboutsia sp. TaxID=1965302 RepID=UPI002B929ABD|nr:hypothetical protein [Romboutsia sp.]HSQ88683.1 hypothetical protein [Romboutsia sp.]
MKRRGGYLLLESIISISVILIIMSILYYLLFFSYNIKTKFEDKVELQQQANEITKYIENIIGNSKGIISIDSKYSNYEGNLINATSIKCKYKNGIKDKEISLKEDLNKLFINTLNDNGTAERGGYEIGDYIDNIYVYMYENGKFIKIKLELSKNDEKFDTEFNINIRNFKGDSM